MPGAHRLVRVAPNVTRHAVLMEAAAYVRRLLIRHDPPVSPGSRTAHEAYGDGFAAALEGMLVYLEAEAAKALDG